VEDCDILMMAGPPQLGEWLQDKPPRLGIFVAHGVCKGTQIFLETCRPALDHVVAVSPLVQDAICAGLPSTVIPNGIDPRHIVQTHSREDVRTALGCRSDEFLIGYVGRFSPEKRPEALIEAVRRLPARFRLVFVGWGDLRHNLLDLASRRIPGRLSVVQANDDLGNYYAAMDAFCFPSEFEGFGLVLLEAMMCARPVITTQVGFAPEGIVDRVNGVLVDGSPESIASAVDLIDRHPTWARAMAAEGRLYAEKAGFASQMARSYTVLFERLWAEKFGS
jgi:glycosyltransferase involved in cell wall biosynthesis